MFSLRFGKKKKNKRIDSLHSVSNGENQKPLDTDDNQQQQSHKTLQLKRKRNQPAYLIKR